MYRLTVRDGERYMTWGLTEFNRQDYEVWLDVSRIGVTATDNMFPTLAVAKQHARWAIQHESFPAWAKTVVIELNGVSVWKLPYSDLFRRFTNIWRKFTCSI